MKNNSKYLRYVILINRQKDYSIDIIKEHVEYLKQLYNKGQLILCGPFKDYDGGLVIIKADTVEEA